LQEFVQEIIEHEALPCSPESDLKPRQEAVRRMIEFREKHQLDLGAPITRAMLHEEHRF